MLPDDLHWADADSIDLIAFLVRRLASLPVTLVGPVRSWPPRALGVVESLVHDGVADVLTVRPLSPGAAGELVRDLVGCSR